ncbi:SDR family NAD(P)-dependent oxidoreductase [Aquihabitans sp. McL0605]|uniref:SDR family NAD(P)-dependent oxidoreductase n=1 Tax=Aquihabitans sp. McL0605 TaxID=3415671 RepID=UPI003CF8F342
MELAGARVLLTGASAGIGAALAPVLAARGATVALVGRRAHRLDEVLAACRSASGSSGAGAGAGAGAGSPSSSPVYEAYVADLSVPDGAEALALQIRDDLGGIDVLINNAGAPMRRKVQDLTTDELQQTMAINFESPVRMALALLPDMLAADRGMVVNVSSFGGRAGIPAEAAYCASKFALAGWSESMALDLWHTGVDVRLVLPGAVDTEIWDRPGNDPAHYSGELESPAAVAQGIIAAIDGDRFEHYLPDLKAVAEFKTAAIDDYLASVRAFADEAQAGTAD